MFDIGGWEILLIGALALIIVGPKDFPRMIRSVGQWVGKARGLAREFQTGMEQAARDADLDEVRKGVSTDIGLNDIQNDVRSLGLDTKRALERPATEALEAKTTPPIKTTSPLKPQTVVAERPAPDRAASAEPARLEPSVARRPPTNSLSRPRDATERAASSSASDRGSSSDDPTAFLESFERDVRSSHRGLTSLDVDDPASNVTTPPHGDENSHRDPPRAPLGDRARVARSPYKS